MPVNPFRRNHKQQLDGDDYADGAAAAFSSATNYLSFSNSGENNNKSDDSELNQDPLHNSNNTKKDVNDEYADDDNHNHRDGSSTAYRGFSTSINDMFTDPANERIDCCALTCCGVLQLDRDRYLLQGIQPPGVWKRFYVHLVMPCCIFLIAGLCAMHIRQPELNQLCSTGLVLTLLLYLFLQCHKGRTKRIELRKDLLWHKYRIIHQTKEGQTTTTAASSTARNRKNRQLYLSPSHERPPSEDEENDSGENPEYYLGQTKWDLACAHPCCIFGLYRDDHPKTLSLSISNEQGDHHHRRNNNDDFCSRLWSLCCDCSPLCCGLHLQVCGTCATAQEARELETFVLPSSYRRIDYVSMQSVMSYYPAIYATRWATTAATTKSNSLFGFSFPPPLSLLSARILRALAVLTSVFLAWCFGGPFFYKMILKRKHLPSHFFGFMDFGVFVATWLQSIGLLVLIRWYLMTTTTSTTTTSGAAPQQRKCELSLDAMIKYFASGFLLSTSLAVFWELVVSIGLRIFVEVVLILSGTGIVEANEYNSVVRTSDHSSSTTPSNHNHHSAASHGKYESPEMFTSFTSSTWMPGFGATFFSRAAASSGSSGRDFLEIFGNDHPVFYTFIIFLNAFIVAAVIEEMCKYFGFRMVEHPDFYTKQELEEASRINLFLDNKHNNNNMDDATNEYHNSDGNNTYVENPYTNDAATTASSDHEVSDYEEYEDEEDGRDGDGKVRRRDQKQKHAAIMEAPSPSHPQSNLPRTGLTDYSNQRHSVQATGSAITLAMIAVAMGFTCCENLVYIFKYTGSSAKMEFTVLISRSFFPVHPIAAALQSVGVCARDLEGNRFVRLGMILLPAVIFHGLYDFFILWIDFLARRHGVYAASSSSGGDDDGGSSSYDEEGGVVAVVVSFFMSVLVMAISLAYLYRWSYSQRQRLANIDLKNSVDRSRLL